MTICLFLRGIMKNNTYLGGHLGHLGHRFALIHPKGMQVHLQ